MKYAYKDKEKTQLVQAENAEQGVVYYCENIDCPARVHIRALDSTKISAYFANYEKFPHSKNCPYKSSYIDIKKYQTKDFDLNLFFKRLFSPEIKSNSKNIINEKSSSNTMVQNTVPLPYLLLKLYKYLLNSPFDDIFCERKISDILVDLRSEHIYTKVIAGEKLLQAKLVYKNLQDKILTFRYPISEKRKNNNKHLYLKIKIDADINFNFFELEENYIIGAFFEDFSAVIYNKKQIKKLAD